jgi:hypothetical protein
MFRKEFQSVDIDKAMQLSFDAVSDLVSMHEATQAKLPEQGMREGPNPSPTNRCRLARNARPSQIETQSGSKLGTAVGTGDARDTRPEADIWAFDFCATVVSVQVVAFGIVERAADEQAKKLSRACWRNWSRSA